MESSPPRARNAFLTAAGVLLALGLVAVSSRGTTRAGDDRSRQPSDALLDLVFSLYLVALASGAVILVYLLVQRRVAKATGVARRRGVLEMLATMFVLAGLAMLFARRLVTWERPPPVEAEEGIGVATAIPADTSALPSSYQAEVAWIPVLVTVGLIALAAAAWWLSSRARRRARGELPSALAAAVAQAVDESLDDLRAEPDPRRAVIAAYARLERVLAAHGLPRKPSEAPLEYLGRMLAEVSVGDRAARALTDLFERAKFSQHAVGPEMKEQAIAALETVRDELHVAQALAERERAAWIEAQRKRAAAQ